MSKPISPTVKRLRAAQRHFELWCRHLFKHINRFIIDRRDSLLRSRSDVVIWLVIIIGLVALSLVQIIITNSKNTTKIAVKGGIYTEGIVGRITTINPIYASTDAEKAASALAYPGLLNYDTQGKLRGRLAQSWSVDTTGKTWTIKLQENLKWSDGTPLTSEDVVFTINLIKNPAVQSPLNSSWRNTSVTAKSPTEITLRTPTPYMSLPNALTFGILPKHILENQSPAEINSISTKTPYKIVGSGALQVSTVETRSKYIAWNFAINPNYYGTKPLINKFVLRVYNSQSDLIRDLKHNVINAAGNVTPDQLASFNNKHYRIIQTTTDDGVFAIFNNSSNILSNELIRQALRLGLDRDAIIAKIKPNLAGMKIPEKLETPLAPHIYSTIDQISQPAYDKQRANALLNQAGWVRPSDSGVRTSNGKNLSLTVATIKGASYAAIANQIAAAWRDLGIEVNVKEVNPDEAQQSLLSPRAYDVLVYQYHLGADPDQYVYWSSSETTDTGLNYANYKSRKADVLLANGRTSIERAKRIKAYTAFVNRWMADAAAIALYRPITYTINQADTNTLPLNGQLVDITHRFYNIGGWTVRQNSAMLTP